MLEIVASSTTNDSEISKLISERKTLEKQRDADSTYIKAPVSGILSYRIDGLEDQLKFADINNYNNEYLESLNLDTGKIIPTSTTEGKIVNNFECYVITNASSEEAKKAINVEGDPTVLPRVFKYMTTFRLDFNIVEP